MPEPASLSQKILGFFLKEAPADTATPGGTDAPSGAPNSAPGSPTFLPPSSAPRPVAAAPSSAPATGALDQKFAEHFAQLLAKNNAPGPDYFEFRDALRGLTDLGLPEEKQYQAAWATFKAMGGPADRAALTATASQYLQVLRADRDAFTQSVEAAIKERVGGLQQEQLRLRADNEALARQLAELQVRQQANAARLQAIEGETAEQRTRLDQSRLNYEATYAHFTRQIEADVARIGQHLGG